MLLIIQEPLRSSCRLSPQASDAGGSAAAARPAGGAEEAAPGQAGRLHRELQSVEWQHRQSGAAAHAAGDGTWEDAWLRGLAARAADTGGAVAPAQMLPEQVPPWVHPAGM